MKTINFNDSSRFISYQNSLSWGGEIMIMEKDGKAFMRIYWYSDDQTTIYLENLSVLPSHRRQGIATELLSIAENVGLKLGATTICLWVLWVKECTWLHDWYIQSGYIDLKDHETEKDAVWMKKSITSH